MSGTYAQALDKLNVDAAIDEYAQRFGIPAVLINDQKKVDEIRSARAQQEQMAKAAAMMPAMRDGAAGAKLLSETDMRGSPLLDQMSPV